MLKKQYRAQSAIEFTLILGFVLFFFILFLAVINENMDEKVKRARDLAVKNLASDVRDEIIMASSASEGYRRSFSLPLKIGNQDYSLALVAGSIYVSTPGAAISLPISNVTGEIVKGENIIQKRGGLVYIN